MSDTVTISKKAPLRVATWSELEDRVPAYALALQTDLVVIRLGDEVSVLYGRCLHRGALMADGRIEGDNLICGLHGWDYRVDTGVSAYANDEILHKFDARIDPSEDAVFIEEADVREFQRVHPQPYDREAYLGLYQDPHGAPEEDANGYIQRLARELRREQLERVPARQLTPRHAHRADHAVVPVSYTHLTLPTN